MQKPFIAIIKLMEELSGKRNSSEKEHEKYSYTEASEDVKYELGSSLDWINWASEKLEQYQKNFYIVRNVPIYK